MSEVFGRALSLRLPPHSDGQGGCYRALALFGRDEAIPAMLELRLKTGARFAFGYAWLSRVAYDPPGVITLRFSGAEVVLTGRNLCPVFEAVSAHLALWVAESDRPEEILVGDYTPVVESIRWAESDSGGHAR